jgi:hypothetical protein
MLCVQGCPSPRQANRRRTPSPPPRPDPKPLELLSGYLAKIGKGNLLTDRQEVILSQKARAGDQNGKK